MTDTSWLTDFWPWWLCMGFLLVYEAYALITKKQRTLSRMVWNASKVYPWSVPIALSIVAWLLIHFYITKGEWAVELPWTAVLVVVIWIGYFAFQRKAV